MLRLTRRGFATAVALTGPVSAAPQFEPPRRTDEAGVRHSDGEMIATFATRASAVRASISEETRHGAVSLLGFHAVGDGGAALYRYAVEQSPGPGRFQSRDGAWWELSASALNVRMFGARADGVSDDAPAFNEASDYLESRGGNLLIPAGRHLLAAPWRIQRTHLVNISITGFGATLVAAPALSGPAIQVVGSMNEFLLDIAGLHFDHRGNTSVQGCIEVLGGHCVDIRRCVAEFHSVRPGYYFASFRSNSLGPRADEANAFWCRVEACTTRKRSGSEPGEGTYGIKLTGATNAFIARDNVLSNLAIGIYAEPDPASKTLPNAVVIEGNAFETISKAAVQIEMGGCLLGPTGWRLAFNRAETLPVFFALASASGAVRPHSQPPLLIGNYCTQGSVKAWIGNPTGHPVSLLETQAPGATPRADNFIWESGSQRGPRPPKSRIQ